MDSEDEKLDNLSDRIREAETKSGGADKPNAAVSMAGSRVGLDFAGGIVGGGVVGAILDYSLHTAPWCMIAMILAGFGVGMRSAWRAMQQPDK